MKNCLKLATALAFAAGALALTASTASAAVACNAAGECWHIHRAWAYPPEAGIVIHPDGWRWGPADHFVWREHAGRGYWRSGVWIRL